MIIPAGWTLVGCLPCFVEDGIGCFDEDLLQVSNGNVTLDVGWYPAGDINGHFICRTVLDKDWEHPVHTLETPERAAVFDWLYEQIAEASIHLYKLTEG